MDFDYTEDQKLLRDMVAQFGKDSVEPLLTEMDETERIPETLLARMADLGLLGLAVPESFGGSGVPLLTQVVVAEALGRVSASLAVTAAYHGFLLPALLTAHGSEEQKRRWLPGIASGEVLGTVAVGAVSLADRPDSARGDGPPGAAIRAVPEGGGERWGLTGRADWVVNGRGAAVGAVFAETGDGVRAFLVKPMAEGDASGDPVEPEKITGKLGLRPVDFARWTFAGSAVDGADRLDLGDPNGGGGGGGGVRRSLRLLSDLFLAAAGVGLIQAGLEVSGEYAKERKQFGRPIGSFQLVQEMIAGMVFDVEAARLLVHRAAAEAQGRDLRLEDSPAAIARARSFAAEAALRAGTGAVQVHGGYGFSTEYPAERLFRDARALALMSGGTGALLRVSAGPILKEALPQADG